MTLSIYQVDAFSDGLFTGNPAAVIPLTEWLSDKMLQSIALENNLSETAFIIRTGDTYHIRWFTPTVEVDLCGHATLASAKVVYDHLDYDDDKITFDSKSGPLYVSRDGEDIILDFPQDEIIRTTESIDEITEALDVVVLELYKGRSDFMCVLADESTVRELTPDFSALKIIESRGLLVTAVADRSSDYDVVSRCFYPQSGINEDPVTGSAHTTIVPYWCDRLGRTTIEAYQASDRGGRLSCEIKGSRILLSGKGTLYMIGKIFI